LYVLQKDRCDWPDIINLVYATGPALDWDHLLNRVKSDRALVEGLMSVFAWLFPERAAEIPETVRRELRMPELRAGAERSSRERVSLLDSRPWFRPELSEASAA
jgi:hypothetical protein